jgi:prevent-host-death family protein
MADVFSLTEARAKFSEIMNRVIYKNEKIILSRRGRKVAVILPFEDYSRITDDELLDAKHILAGTESLPEEIADSRCNYD